MPTPRPFRFGVQADGTGSRDEWVARALPRRGARLRHLAPGRPFRRAVRPRPRARRRRRGDVSLRIGTFVYANDFRHPALLAKEAATLDVLSEGRFELGLGAGWLRDEYEAVGLPFEPPGVRLDRLPRR
jgi:hypothetical protein